MKNIYLFCVSAFIGLASCGPTRTVYQQPAPTPPPPVYNDPTPPQQAVEQDVTFQTFYDDLSPYGAWIEYPGYGYVWQPDAGPDFRPYSTNGDWIYTDAGWTWNSNYQWGWAPFHYGRWFYQGGYGWMWVPGSEWAPAWVSWRGNSDYYGWAPLSPDVSMDVAMNSYNPPSNYWNFMPVQYMGNPGWNQYYVNEGRNVTIINNTTIINNYSAPQHGRYNYAPGPDPNEVRRYTGNNIRPVVIREANRPVSNVSGNQYNIYRPRVAAAPGQRANNGSRPQPATVRPYQPSANPRPATATQPTPAGNNNGYNNNRPPATSPGNNNGNNNNGYNPRPVIQNPNTGSNGNNAPVTRPSPAVPNPANGNNGNNGNGRPSAQPAPVNNNPLNNNPRPVSPNPSGNTRPAIQNPPVNNVPAGSDRSDNLPRPNPVNRVPQSSPQPSAPVNNPRPVSQPSAPVNNPRPVSQPSAPVNNPRPVSQPSAPVNNPRPVLQPSAPVNNPRPAPAARPAPAPAPSQPARPATSQPAPADNKPKTRQAN